MTPDFVGRLQTRLFLTALIGLPVGLLFNNSLPVLLMLLFGLNWDVIYHFVQSKRSDGDWPPIYILISGALEGLVLWQFLQFYLKADAANFTVMYILIFSLMFI